METKIIFTNKLEELTALAEKNAGVLTRLQVEEYLGSLLNEEQLNLVFQYLEQQKIRVEGWSQTTQERLAGRRQLYQQDESKGGSEESNLQNRDETAGGEEDSPQHQAAVSGFASLFGKMDDAAEGDAGEVDEDAEDETVILSVLEQYLEELGELSETDSAQRLQLLRAASQGDAAALEKAAVSYLPMICDLAGEYEKDAVLPVEDLIQEGNIALWTQLSMLQEVESLAAAEAQLMNAVSKHMEEVLKQELDESDSDQAMARKVNRLHEAVKSLEEDAGRSVSVDELSAFLEMPSEEIRDILKLAGDNLKLD